MTFAIFLICLLVVAWLSAGAMAVRSASRIWLRHWAEQRLRGAATVLVYLERPQRLVSAAQAGAALTVGLAGLWIGWRGARNDSLAMASLVGYATLLILFGHLLPRAIGRRWPSRIIPITVPVLSAIESVTSPLVSLGRGGADVETPQAGPAPAVHDALQDLLREGEMEGVGKREEIAIISGVMEFGGKKVSEVLTTRDDVFAVPRSADARAVAALIAESAFSRIPVYADSLDSVVGMYHAFDVLKARGEHLPPLRPVAYAAADTHCNELLFRMLKARLHLAVVQDAQHRTLGVVTLENLLEELVGDIRDEHDDPANVTPSGIASV